MEHKFKVGDIVRGNNKYHYNYTNADMTKAEVKYVYSDGFIDVLVLEHKNANFIRQRFCHLETKYFDLVERPANPEVKFPVMHIYTDGKTTTAVYKHDGIKETAKAVCSPDDEFDFLIGAKLAVERLEKKPKLLNTKFVCLTDGVQGMTRGKIYEVKDGQFKRDNDCTVPFIKPLEDIEDLRAFLGWKDFNFKKRVPMSSVVIDFVEVVE